MKFHWGGNYCLMIPVALLDLLIWFCPEFNWSSWKVSFFRRVFFARGNDPYVCVHGSQTFFWLENAYCLLSNQYYQIICFVQSFCQCDEELEERGLKVLTATCNGASPYKFHSKSGTTQGTPIYETPNPYSAEKRFIFSICDTVHLLKTARNNWGNSF